MLVMLAMTLSTAVPCTAAESEQDYSAYADSVDLLSALGIISDDIDVADMDRPAEKAELVDMAVGLRNVRGMSVTTSQFSDINDKVKCGKGVMSAEAVGIITKTSDGMFHPEAPVKYTDAREFLLNVLGYAPVLLAGYSDGYNITDASTELAKNVKTDKDGYLTVAALVQMFENALSIEVMHYYPPDSYSSNGKTAMEEFLEIYKRTGRITSIYNKDAAGTKITGLDKVYIDGVEYNLCAGGDIEQYLGYEVNYYCKDDEDDNSTVLYMSPTRRNSSVIIDCDGIDSFEEKTLKYNNNTTGKSKTARFETDFVLCNGESELISADSFNFTGYDGGYIKIVDSDNNGVYDFANIIKYNNYYVENINMEKELIYTDKSEVISLNVDDYSSNTSIILYEKYRNIISIGSIQKGDILSIARSSSNSLITVYRSSKKVSGTVGTISENEGKTEVQVGDEIYTVRDPEISVKPDGQYVFYVDFMDTVAYIDENGSESAGYAYLIKTWPDECGDIFFTLFTDDGEILSAKAANKIKVGTENSGTSISGGTSSYSKLSNILFDTADEGGNGANQLIKYRKNSNGEITSVVTAQKDKSLNEFSLDYCPDSGYVRGGIYIDGTYRISYGDTAVFCVPADLGEYAKYSVVREMDSSVYYPNLKLYDIDEDSNVVGEVVYRVDSQTYKSTAVTYSALGVVKNVTEIVNDENEIVTRLEFMINGENNIMDYEEGETLKSASGSDVVKPQDLHCGDVLQAYIGADKKIAACRLAYVRENADEGIYKLSTPSSIVDDNIVMYGEIKYTDGDYMVLSEKSGLEAVGALSGARVYVYDSEIRGRDKVRLGDISDLFKGYEVVIKKSATAYNQIVVFK